MKIRINYGGSNRQNSKAWLLLLPHLDGNGSLPAGLGSKRRTAIVTDSPELRALLPRINGSVARNQEAWINQ